MIALVALVALAASAAPTHAAVELHGRSAHVQLIADRVWPVGVPVPLTARNRHDDRAIRFEVDCAALPVKHEGAWLGGAGTRGVRRLGPLAEGAPCTWTGRWTDGTTAAPGHYGVALPGRIDGNAVVDGGGTVAWPVTLVAPAPIDPAAPVVIPMEQGFAATPDGRLVLGFDGPGMLQPGLETAQLRAWIDGRLVELWLSRTGPDDPLASRVVAGWRVSLDAVFPPEHPGTVVLRVEER